MNAQSHIHSPSLLTHTNPISSRGIPSWRKGVKAVMDLGSQQIKCLVGRGREDGTLDILGHNVSPSSGIINGSITDIDQANLAVRNALSDAEKSAKRKINTITLGFNGGNPRSEIGDYTFPIKGGEVTQDILDSAAEDIKNRAHEEDRVIVHLLAREYRTSGADKIKNPLGHLCHKLTVSLHIIHIDAAAIADLKRVMQESEVVVENIVYTPLAAPLCVFNDQEREQGSTLINAGADLTSIIFFKGGLPIWTTQLKKGGRSITQDIAFGLDTNSDEAERLKTMYDNPASSAPQKLSYHHLGQSELTTDTVNNAQLHKIIEPRARENLEKIARALQETYQDPDAAGGCQEACQHVVITGGAVLLDGLNNLADDILLPSLFSDARRNVPFFARSIFIGRPRIGLEDMDENLQPIYTSAVGLLIWALLQNPPYPDVIHPPQREKSFFEKIFGIFWKGRHKV